MASRLIRNQTCFFSKPFLHRFLPNEIRTAPSQALQSFDSGASRYFSRRIPFAKTDERKRLFSPIGGMDSQHVR